MNKSLALIASIILVAVLFSPVASLRASSAAKVYVISISGEIEPVIAAYLKRSLREIPANANATLILEIDTFGGRVDSALAMVDMLLNADGIKTIAYVKTKAISAGALIALASNELIMKEGTTIGDCAPITYSSEGPKMLGEKFQSPLRAKFRALAKRNGYPQVLAEAMVTAEMEVYAVTVNGETQYMDAITYGDLTKAEKAKISAKKTVVAKGELLTMDDIEAHELGFSKMSVAGLADLRERYIAKPHELIRIDRSWSEVLGRFIGSISPILMLIGLAAIYTEIKAPGFGVPGIIGITSLGLVFMNQYLVGMADYTEFLILGAGIILLGFELFVIPGFGLAGIGGLLLMTLAMILGLQDFVLPDPALPWEKELLTQNAIHVMGALVGGFVTALFFLRYVLPRFSRIIEGPYLNTTLEAAHADSKEAQALRAGAHGMALTPLRPAGKMKIGVDMVDVVTQGEFIEKGARITVFEIDGNRVIVTKEE